MNREYKTLKFSCDKRHSDNILVIDGEYKRMIVDEYEDELHVCFTWRKIFEWLAYLLIVVSLLFFISKIFFALSIVSFLTSKFLVNKYRVILRYYNMSVALVDLEIYKKSQSLIPEIK
jgi:hypothetical protein